MDEWVKTVFVLSMSSKDGMDENVALSSDIARIAIERAVLGRSDALLVRTGGPSCKSSCCRHAFFVSLSLCRRKLVCFSKSFPAH